MNKILVTEPFCSTCGAIRPKGTNHSHCIPCAHSGHMSRLVMDETDRCVRFARWVAFLSEQEFTMEELKATPVYQNLTKYTFRPLYPGVIKNE